MKITLHLHTENGQWYFQHFHDKNQLVKMLEEKGFKIIKINWNKYGATFQVEAQKIKTLSKDDYVKAIDFEFNLPLPNNKRYNRHNEMKKVLKLT